MVNSIDTDNQKRDGHLRSDDFFNAKKYPKITFQSDEIVRTGDNQFVAKGELTIKDVTKNIELPFTLLGIREHPMQEDVQLAGVKLNYTLDRNTYNGRCRRLGGHYRCWRPSGYYCDTGTQQR